MVFRSGHQKKKAYRGGPFPANVNLRGVGPHKKIFINLSFIVDWKSK